MRNLVSLFFLSFLSLSPFFKFVCLPTPILSLSLLFDYFYTSSHGGLAVEQWSDNRTLFISVDQSLLGAYIDGSRAVVVYLKKHG